MRTSNARYIVDIDADGRAAPLSSRDATRVVETVLRLEKVHGALLSVAFVSNRRIASMNRKHLGHSGATDVIAFPLGRVTRQGPIVGDIYIAPDVANANARTNEVPLREEVVRLLVHGTLHVLGYTHPSGDQREHSKMWKRQEQLVRKSLTALAQR